MTDTMSTPYSPTFPYKLVQMLNDTQCHSFNWNREGDQVLVDINQFERELLRLTPIRWRYQINWTSRKSLVRQFNAYGFQRRERDSSNMKYPGWMFAYSHPLMVRGKPNLLADLKRSSSNSSSKDNNQATSEPSKDNNQAISEPSKPKPHHSVASTNWQASAQSPTKLVFKRTNHVRPHPYAMNGRLPQHQGNVQQYVKNPVFSAYELNAMMKLAMMRSPMANFPLGPVVNNNIIQPPVNHLAQQSVPKPPTAEVAPRKRPRKQKYPCKVVQSSCTVPNTNEELEAAIALTELASMIKPSVLQSKTAADVPVKRRNRRKQAHPYKRPSKIVQR